MACVPCAPKWIAVDVRIADRVAHHRADAARGAASGRAHVPAPPVFCGESPLRRRDRSHAVTQRACKRTVPAVGARRRLEHGGARLRSASLTFIYRGVLFGASAVPYGRFDLVRVPIERASRR